MGSVVLDQHTLILDLTWKIFEPVFTSSEWRCLFFYSLNVLGDFNFISTTKKKILRLSIRKDVYDSKLFLVSHFIRPRNCNKTDRFDNSLSRPRRLEERDPRYVDFWFGRRRKVWIKSIFWLKKSAMISIFDLVDVYVIFICKRFLFWFRGIILPKKMYE